MLDFELIVKHLKRRSESVDKKRWIAGYQVNLSLTENVKQKPGPDNDPRYLLRNPNDLQPELMRICACVCVWTADGVSNSLRFIATTKEQEIWKRRRRGYIKARMKINGKNEAWGLAESERCRKGDRWSIEVPVTACSHTYTIRDTAGQTRAALICSISLSLSESVMMKCEGVRVSRWTAASSKLGKNKKSSL